MAVKFDAPKRDLKTIEQIVARAEELELLQHDAQHLEMDLEAVHCNGTPLDLEKLLTAGDFDFAHDIGGIQVAIDRTTGQLRNDFLPRCARPSVAVAS